MNSLKYAIISVAIVFCFSLNATAQETDGERKIPKPNPPVVIVNSEKKGNDKPESKSSEEKRGNKPQSFLTD